MRGWSSGDQAVTLNALDQGLIDLPDPVAARRRLAAAKTHKRRPSSLQARALTALLEDRTAAGEPIERVIGELVGLSENHPIDFACQIGEGLVSLGVLQDKAMRASDTAERVRRLLDLPIGRYPRTSRRTLYRYHHESR